MGRTAGVLVTMLLLCSLALHARGAGPWLPPSTAMPAADSLRREPERLVASVLAIGLGTFGAHRIYLGTRPGVPIIYGITFGGFGVLPLLDLGHLLFTKDLGPYRNNRQVFMWAAPRKPITPP
ncbi:MAG TPA: TM2 domain-containing protein [Flavobacteriales bacterium]|nr:TM2 domain-containing protein [Flavobacteriales bacterium]HMR26729.1 TM2 domain-containing protein [Flavobacteriales bacterium]